MMGWIRRLLGLESDDEKGPDSTEDTSPDSDGTDSESPNPTTRDSHSDSESPDWDVEGPIGDEFSYSDPVSPTEKTESPEPSADDSPASESQHPVEDPTKEDLIDAIRELSGRTEGTPSLQTMQERGPYSRVTYYKEFDSWNAAVRKAGLDPNDPHNRIPDEELADELQRLKDDLGHPPTPNDVVANAQYSAQTYRNRYEDWEEALTDANLDPDSLPDQSPDDSGPDYSREDLLDALTSLAEELDKTPSMADMDEQGRFDSHDFYTHFSSWNNAVEAAGLEPNSRPHVRASKSASDTEESATQDTIAETSEGTETAESSAAGTRSPESLTNRERGRLLDIVELSPASNSELQDRWDLESGKAVHYYLESHLAEYYYRDSEDYIRATDEAKQYIQDTRHDSVNDATGSVPQSDGHSENIDLERRDLVLELVAVTQQLGRLATAEEINEQAEYSHQQYRDHFGSLIEAYKEAGLIPESASPTDITRLQKRDIDEAEASESPEAPADPDDQASEQDEATARSKMGGHKGRASQEKAAAEEALEAGDVEAAKEHAKQALEHLQTAQDIATEHNLAPSEDLDTSITNIKRIIKEATRKDLKPDPGDADETALDTSKSQVYAELTGFQRDLLFVLNGLDGPKGLEIKEEVEQYYDETIHHGRLYPNLDTLVEKGLVEKFELDARSNGYRLTDRGRRLILTRRSWVRTRIPELDKATEDTTQTAESSDDDQNDRTDTEDDDSEDLMSEVDSILDETLHGDS